MKKLANQATVLVQNKALAALVILLKSYGKAVLSLELEKEMLRRMGCIVPMLLVDTKRLAILLANTKRMWQKDRLVKTRAVNWMK